MSTAFFTSPALLAPLQGLFRWFASGALPAGRAVKVAIPQRSIFPLGSDTTKFIPNYSSRTWEKGINNLSIGTAMPLRGQPRSAVAPVASLRRVVRVTRLLEAGQAPACVGRMVISGRMADVCAELDRLVAGEAALH